MGQRDWQQYLIVRQLQKELFISTKVRWISTVREESGLAVSSRNKRLSTKEKAEAILFHKALKLSQAKLLEGAVIEAAVSIVHDLFDAESPTKLEYFNVVDSESLEEVTDVSKHEQISLCIAGYVGEVRLIDNIFLFPTTQPTFAPAPLREINHHR